MNQRLFEQLRQVEKIASFTRLGRLLHHPSKYISAIYFLKCVYPKRQQERVTTTELFYGRKMRIALPASTDIYLTGGKSHDSEIRLARFLIRQLNPGDHFLDIGAHYGYFSLLAAELTGNTGRVVSFEPAQKSFTLLQENTAALSNTSVFRKAVSNAPGILHFYEFPNLQSEYNSLDVTQFEQEEWFKKTPPVKVDIPATTIDEITGGNDFNPLIIKIDVEGAEHSVIQGGLQFINKQTPFVVLEYLEPKRHNEGHKQALQLLAENGYGTWIISKEGLLEPVTDIDRYLLDHRLESDNIVFRKV